MLRMETEGLGRRWVCIDRGPFVYCVTRPRASRARVFTPLTTLGNYYPRSSFLVYKAPL